MALITSIKIFKINQIDEIVNRFLKNGFLKRKSRKNQSFLSKSIKKIKLKQLNSIK